MKAVVPAMTLIMMISVLAWGIGCARPAPPPAPPSPAAVAKPPATAPSAKPAPAPKPDALAQIIEGAKKEGTVSASTLSTYAPAPIIQAIRDNIKAKYGVDLNIKMVGSGAGGYGGLLAKAVMELRAGTAPTFDLVGMTDQFLALATKEGVFEKVDWKPLLPAGTPPEVIPAHPSLAGSVVFVGTSTGLMYNPSKVPADQVPRTLKDLADPKWKGRLGVMNYQSHWARWAYVLGKEKTVATLREILKTKPMLGEMPALNNLYLVGEIDLAFMSSPYIQQNQTKGLPTAYRALDYLDARNSYLSVAKNAQHPNAAKLLAIYLASADGVKFSAEKAGGQHFFYPGNHLYDIVVQAKKEGIPMHAVDTYPGLLEFTISPENEAWEKELQLIIKGGGG